jgi:hypothetical protein
MSEATENSPLLAVEPISVEISNEDTGVVSVSSEYTPANAYFKRSIRIITRIVLAAAVIAILIIIASSILFFIGQFRYRYRVFMELLVGLGLLVCSLTYLNIRNSSEKDKSDA